MDKLTLLLGILIGLVVVLYLIPVWRELARPLGMYEGFSSSSSSAAPRIGSSSSSASSFAELPIIGSSSSSASVARTTQTAPTCPPQANIEDAVSKAISDALGRMGGAGGSIRNKKTMNFGAAAGTSGLGMPMQSPPLDMQKLIEMAKALVDPSITVDSDSVRTKFTYKYGSANSLTPTQLADVYLIYLEYPNFYYNFYSILDQSNKDVFRKSYLSEQSQAISMINTFGMEVMIYLHQQLDPNFEADFGDQYEEGGGEDDMTGTCKTDKALIEELKKCLTSSDVNCVQKVLNKYSETNITNITNTDNTTIKPPPDDTTTKPPPDDTTTEPPPTNQNMGSSSSYLYPPGPTVPVGSSSSYRYPPGPTVPVGSSSSYGLVIPPPTTTSTGKPLGGAGTGSGSGSGGGTGAAGEEECGDEDIEVIVNMAPPPAPATASVSSCPVCSGGGCNICSGTGSPSLGQGTNWKYITPQVSKCKTEEPIDMRWGY